MQGTILIKNGRVLLDGNLFKKDLLIENGIIKKVSSDIQSIDAKIIDVRNRLVFPGFIDIHTHGAVGVDMNNVNIKKLEKVGAFFASQGVTSYLPTLLTDSKEKYIECLRVFRDAREEIQNGAKILGVHLEGPYLVPEYKGAMPEELLQTPSIQDIDDYLALSQGGLVRMTVSPEISRMSDFVSYLRSKNVEVSLGHSGATYEETWKCIHSGATSSTHTFNAMRLLHQHEPAICGAVLESDVYSELICDGLHLHPGIIRLMLKTKGVERCVVVTDSIMAAGLPDGKYKLGVNDIEVIEGDAQLIDGNSRAGSTLTMIQALKNLVEFTLKKPHQLVPMLTQVPAEVMGIQDSKGSIGVGKDADLVILDEDLSVFKTLSLGKVIFEKR